MLIELIKIVLCNIRIDKNNPYALYNKLQTFVLITRQFILLIFLLLTAIIIISIFP